MLEWQQAVFGIWIVAIDIYSVFGGANVVEPPMHLAGLAGAAEAYPKTPPVLVEWTGSRAVGYL